jgi:hypothetical protein
MLTERVGTIMRKRLITSEPPTDPEEAWLNLGTSVTLELTSEAPAHPIEDAISGSQGWRASEPGPQTIRLVFDRPQRLKRINLNFNEVETARTHEFVLRWRSESDPGFREIVRQQWNFSPPQAVRESEDYRVDLEDVKILELVIIPDINRGNKYASLELLRIA